MSYLNSDKNNVSLEWAAMLVGVVVIFVTAYVIFGTEWNVYRVVNVLLGVAFIVFITYAYTNASNLKKALKGSESEAHAMSKENESLRSAIGGIELTLEKTKNDNDTNGGAKIVGEILDGHFIDGADALASSDAGPIVRNEGTNLLGKGNFTLVRQQFTASASGLVSIFIWAETTQDAYVDNVKVYPAD